MVKSVTSERVRMNFMVRGLVQTELKGRFEARLVDKARMGLMTERKIQEFYHGDSRQAVWSSRERGTLEAVVVEQGERC